MADELTPEEIEALKGLPKERMPSAGLEARVVGAMHERNILARKRRRTIEITNSRVAGLLAASLTVIIGAYSMGVYWGGSDRFVPELATIERNDSVGDNASASDRSESMLERPSLKVVRSTLSSDGKENEESSVDRDQTPEASEEGRTKLEQDVATAPAAEEEAPSRETAALKDALQPPTASAPQDKLETKKKSDHEKAPSSLATLSEQEISPQPTTEAELMMKQNASRSRSANKGLAAGSDIYETTKAFDVSSRPLTFVLNGQTVIIEAPDSVRITKDDRGRMLLIYTSDGIIRIRLIDD